MTAPNKTEIRKATHALIAWFKSQEIKPAEAELVMANLITADLAARHDRYGGGDVGLEIYIKMLREMYNFKIGAFE